MCQMQRQTSYLAAWVPGGPKPGPKDQQPVCNHIIILCKTCGNLDYLEKTYLFAILFAQSLENTYGISQ